MDSNLIFGIHWAGIACDRGSAVRFTANTPDNDLRIRLEARAAAHAAHVALDYFDQAEDQDAVAEIMNWL